MILNIYLTPSSEIFKENELWLFWKFERLNWSWIIVLHISKNINKIYKKSWLDSEKNPLNLFLVAYALSDRFLNY